MEYLMQQKLYKCANFYMIHAGIDSLRQEMLHFCVCEKEHTYLPIRYKHVPIMFNTLHIGDLSLCNGFCTWGTGRPNPWVESCESLK